MQITLPIAAYARQLIEWLRTGVVSFGPVAVDLPLPTLEPQQDRVLLRWAGGPSVHAALGPLRLAVTTEPLAELSREGCPEGVFSLLSTGRMPLKAGAEFVASDLMGFTVSPEGDGVCIQWDRGSKPRIDFPLMPKFCEPTVMAVYLYPTRGRVVIRIGPDVEIVYE